MRSLSFTRSSAGVAELGDPLGERGGDREHRDLVDHERDLVALDGGAVQRRRRHPQVAHRLAEPLAGVHDLDGGAHAREHVDERDARRVARDALDHEHRSPGVMAAPTTQNAADDGSPGTPNSNGSGAPVRTRTVVAVDAFERGAERREHALGVVAARVGLGDLGDAGGLQPREQRARSSPARSPTASTCAHPASSPPSTVSGGERAVVAAVDPARPSRAGARRCGASVGVRRRFVTRQHRAGTADRRARPVSMRMLVPEFPQSTTSAGSVIASRPRPSMVTAGAGDGDRHAQLREHAPRAVDVVAAGQAGRAGAAVGHRREEQRTVRDALVAGDPQPAPQQARDPRP